VPSRPRPWIVTDDLWQPIARLPPKHSRRPDGRALAVSLTGGNRPWLRPRQVPQAPACPRITPKIARCGLPHGSGLGRVRYILDRTFA
jgi:hypothetical protein